MADVIRVDARPGGPQKPGAGQGSAGPANAVPGADGARMAFEMLLQTEAEARRAGTVGELQFLIANDAMKLCRARQVFVAVTTGKQPRVAQVSSVGKIDPDSPRIRWIEAMLANLQADAGLAKRREFVLPAYCPTDDGEHKVYPFRFMVWVPFSWNKQPPFAGMLLAREIPWNEQDQLIASRLAETFSHAWTALTGTSGTVRRFAPGKIALGVAALIGLAGFIPVPLTVLAPTEVTSIDPQVVASPIDGVIEQVLVAPNQVVTKGQPVVRLSATTLRNELAVAERNIGVAQARLKQVTQSAVGDPSARGELAIARSELQLAEAKRDYASDMLGRTEIHAPSAGVAVFGDPRDWIGRPVSTGERVMEVANPQQLELRIDLPVADSIALKQGAKVRAFLDSSPLSPVEAKVRTVTFEAQSIENNTMAYRIYATLGDQKLTRLGTRGTAQVYGDNVPLAFYVFRRPVAAMRQWLGL